MDNLAKSDGRPLFVDLDGTLLATDTLFESVLILVKKHPLRVLSLLIWLLRGKAFLKRQIANRVGLSPVYLPFRKGVLDFLKKEKAAGKELILASASDQQVADRIGDYLGIFSLVIASNGVVNLAGQQKLAAIEQRAGNVGFEYIGNSADDLAIWSVAQRAILVNPSARTLSKARKLGCAHQLIASEHLSLAILLKALRVHQWVKNILLYVPLLMAHRFTELDLVLKAFVAVIAFSLCASSMYIVNDLMDLDADRQHPTKRRRAFAAGLLQIKTGAIIASLFLLAAFLLAFVFQSPLFVAALTFYLTVTTVYSFGLKGILLLDVFVLAGVYSLRILAGAVAVGVTISPWLLAFSMFFFLSLAFLKRYAELEGVVRRENRENQELDGRGYGTADIDLIRSLGPASGYIAVMVLALYINSQDVVALYRFPFLLWLICPPLLYWVTRVWFVAHRGNMDDDPVVFALRDKVSYLVGSFVIAVILLASW